MKLFIFGLMLCSFAHGFETGFSREAEVPEPLIFDLVRRLNSDKGELEVNFLIVQDRASELKDTYIAPEIEYSFAQGKAIELELPTAEGKIKAFKTALQFQLPDIFNGKTGMQIIYENFLGEKTQEGTLIFVYARKLDSHWSSLTMLGNRFVDGDKIHGHTRSGKELPILNQNLFYNYAENFDFGIEINLRGVGASFEELLVVPQIHSLLAHDFKIQTGLGVAHDGYVTSLVSAFRFIKEFN